MRSFFFAPAAAACLLALFGCAALPDKSNASPKEAELVIPDMASAKEQYGYARAYSGMQVISGEEKKRNVQLNKLIQCFEAVVRRFPEDRVHTPLSKLEIADCRARQNDLSGALSSYQAIADDYTDREYIHVRALYSKGKVLDLQQRFQEAKDLYKDIIDNYSGSTDANVRQLVKKAQAAYVMPRERPKSKSGALFRR